MPHINELIALTRPVQGTDTLVIETPEGTRRLAAIAFKGEQGERGFQGDQGQRGLQGIQGVQGLQGVPGTAAGTREVINLVTQSLGNNQSEKGIFSMATSFEILRVVLSGTARVRLYNTVAARDADFGRSVFTAPTWGAGLILDINAVSVLDQSLDPHAHGSSMELMPSSVIAYTVTNLGVTGVITVGFTFLRKEQ